LLAAHGDSIEGSKTLLRKRWAQVRKQDHPPTGKMKAVDVYKYMYFVADKLDFDWSTVLTSGEEARVGRKCYDAPKPGETPDVPAQIVPKTRKFKQTRWHDVMSYLMSSKILNTQAGRLKTTCWSQKGSTRRKSVKEARQIARGQIGRRLRCDLKNKEQLSTAQGRCGAAPPHQMNFNSGRR
jgi:hypothetical protein